MTNESKCIPLNTVKVNTLSGQLSPLEALALICGSDQLSVEKLRSAPGTRGNFESGCAWVPGPALFADSLDKGLGEERGAQADFFSVWYA